MKNVKGGDGCSFSITDLNVKAFIWRFYSNRTYMIPIEKQNVCGRYDFPVLRAIKEVPSELLPFNHAKSVRRKSGRWLHFFVDDYQFERIWNKGSRYLELIRQFDGVIAPDFSMWADMPLAHQIYNCWRNRCVAYWLQQEGVPVIPCVEWSDRKSLEWCLDGLPKQSTLAVQTNGCFKDARTKMNFIKGMEYICGELDPAALVLYGRGKEEFGNYFRNAFWFDSYCQQMKKRL